MAVVLVEARLLVAIVVVDSFGLLALMARSLYLMLSQWIVVAFSWTILVRLKVMMMKIMVLQLMAVIQMMALVDS